MKLRWNAMAGAEWHYGKHRIRVGSNGMVEGHQDVLALYAGHDGVEVLEDEPEVPEVVEVVEVDLDDMTVAELKDFAEMNEIDLGGARRKADIIKAIQDT